MREGVCLGMKVRSVVSFISFFVYCLLVFFPESCRAALPRKRPNIIFVVCDDLGEQNNIAAEHDDFLIQQIMAAQTWSGTHIDPLWHDTEASFQSWVENQMPRYDETFRVRRPVAKGSK